MELCPHCGAALPEGRTKCPVCQVAGDGHEDSVPVVLPLEPEQGAALPLVPPSRMLEERLEQLLSTAGRRRAARVGLSLALVAALLLVSVAAWRAFVSSAWGARLRGMNQIVFAGAPVNPLMRSQASATERACITIVDSSGTLVTTNGAVRSECADQNVALAAPGASLPGRGGLYLVRPDGSGLHRLTALPPGAYFSPVWSPDGSRIAAFVISPAPGYVARLVIMDADGTNVHLISSVSLMIGAFGGGFNEVMTPLTRLISWSPDGRQLVAPVASGQFVLIQADGSGLRQFNGILPTWSPDGRWLAYYVHDAAFDGADEGEGLSLPYADPSLKIRLLNTSTWQAQDVQVPANLSGAALAWSPDGRFLAYSAVHLPDARAMPTGSVMLVRLNGLNPRVVVQWSGGLVGQIAWSPDGRQLAVVVNEVVQLSSNPALLTSQELWLVNSDSTHPRNLGLCDGNAPSWSPDGRHLIFANRLDILYSSVLIEADTDISPVKLHRLVPNVPFAFAPSWSPLAGL